MDSSNQNLDTNNRNSAKLNFDLRILRLTFGITFGLYVVYAVFMLNSILNSPIKADKAISAVKQERNRILSYADCCMPPTKVVPAISAVGNTKPTEPIPALKAEIAPVSPPPPADTPKSDGVDRANPATNEAGDSPAGVKSKLDEALAGMEKDEEYLDYCIEQYLRCAACHTGDKRHIGPPLYEVYELYKDNFEGVIEWAKKPGKRRPDYQQMLPIMIKEKQLRAASLYLMKVGRDAYQKRKQADRK